MRTPILGCYNGNYCDDDDAPKKVTQYNLHIMFDAMFIDIHFNHVYVGTKKNKLVDLSGYHFLIFFFFSLLFFKHNQMYIFLNNKITHHHFIACNG